MAKTGIVPKDDGTYDVVVNDVIEFTEPTEAAARTALEAYGIYAVERPTGGGRT